MANFFINRPIVAIVISIMIVMIGVVTIRGLSVEQARQVARDQTVELQGEVPRLDGQVTCGHVEHGRVVLERRQQLGHDQGQ